MPGNSSIVSRLVHAAHSIAAVAVTGLPVCPIHRGPINAGDFFDSIGQERPFANLYNAYSGVFLLKCGSLTVISFISVLARHHELGSVYLDKETITLTDTGFCVVTCLNEHNSHH
jgi:hypothetical protein